MTEQQLREEMVQIGASLFSRGYATGSAGNLSLLLPDGNLLATPTGACLGELQAQRLSVVTLQGEWISGDKPSKEVTFHRAVYLHNPACKAIVHLHSHYLTALSCLQGLGHCCKVSDEAAFCLIQRPYISKTLLTR
ncbi:MULTISPECIES: class II aldolase/adducin family protein, partial [Enterobacteriaceae]